MSEPADLSARIGVAIEFARSICKLASSDHTQIVEMITAARKAGDPEMERLALSAVTSLREAAEGQVTLANCAIEIIETCRKLADDAAMAAIVPSDTVKVLDRKRRRKRENG